MKQERERFRPQPSSPDRGVDTILHRMCYRIDTSGIWNPSEASRERKLWEIRFGLRQEGSKKEQRPKEAYQASNDFEPFVVTPAIL